MKRIIKYTCVLFLVTIIGFSNLNAQVNILPVHQNSELFLFDQLLQVNVLNVSGINQTGYLEVSIEDNSRNSITTVRSAPLILPQGGMQNSNSINWQNNARFGNNVASQIISETGKLPLGEYVICYRFLSSTSQVVLGTNCQEKTVKPFGLPELVSPYNREMIKSQLPLLTWRPPLPSYNFNVQYSIRLTERKKGQSMGEALLNNFPLVQQNSLSKTAMLYPSSALPLEVGKTYVWQVSASYDNMEIGQTDIWQFTYGEQAKARQMVAGTTYATLKRKLDGSFFLTDPEGMLRFQIKERYNVSDVDIAIYDYKREKKATNRIATAKNNVNHQFGNNYYELDLRCVLSHNNYYVLEIKTQSKEHFMLRFRHNYNPFTPCAGPGGGGGVGVGTGGGF